MKIRRLLPAFLLLVITFSLTPAVSARPLAGNQVSPPLEKAVQLLATMTPAERVGQLFLVSFNGTSVSPDSQIYDLIVNHHVGGVIFLAQNDNFVGAPDTVTAVRGLVSQLQQAEWQASQGGAPSPAGTATPQVGPTPEPSQYIPLFTGISQEGDGYPNDQILDGLTPLPSLMAIGATWDPALAQQVGVVAGQELEALGFNFYIGPSLDVLDSPEATLGNGLNSNVFGGDPYWVGTLGSAYISGLHTGSQGRMVVVADHFPGRGSADRPAGEEPATVRKGLEELKKIELAPYFAVTGDAKDQLERADGLLVSHIRYQGFQGNIRSTTRPVSFDPQALSQILSLPEFTSWRQSGGLMVSDDLGSPTVRSFYDPGKQSFLARVVARDAFLAGNDLLYMGNIVSSDASDNYSTIVQTMDFFVQKYNEDSAFKKSVDDAVTRILAEKYTIYDNFTLETVSPPEDGLALVNQPDSQAVTSEVARQSATLVSPDNTLELETILPNPPGINDHLLFLTDTRTASQCSTCGASSMIAVDALQNVILRLYGSKAGGQIMPGRLVSYSFDALDGILAGGGGNAELEKAIQGSSWVVISMLDAEPGLEQTTSLKRFLSERQDLLRDKHVILFSFNAPYYLDATDISKLTAYYCLYGKSAPFVEVAARLLFREVTPSGALPVSVAGYDLLTATSPDPSQTITLTIPSSSGAVTGTPAPTGTPSFSVGQTVQVQTGVILDHNRHPVPDGTGVHFTVGLNGVIGIYQQMDALTADGIASATFNISQVGLYEVRATSDPALQSVTLRLDVSSGQITIATPAPITEPTPTATIAPTATPEPPAPVKQSLPGFGGWFSMMVILSGAGYAAYWLGGHYASRRWGIRWANCVVVGGLLAYTYLAMRLPGALAFLQNNGWSGIIGLVILGAFFGGGCAYAWFRAVNGSAKRPGSPGSTPR